MNGAFFDQLAIRPGETWVETYALYDEAGALIDTTGWTVKLQIRLDPADVTPLLDISTANYITVGRVNTGTTNEYDIRIAVPPSVTGLLTDFGKAVFDIVTIDPTGVVDAPIYGFVSYWAAVTR